MHKSYTRDARCKDYNNDGTLRTPGDCSQPGRCRFVHPSDGVRWGNARPSVLIPSLSFSSANSSVVGASVPSVFRGSPVTSKASETLAFSPSLVSGDTLAASNDGSSVARADSVHLGSFVYSPTSSPAPSFRDLNEHPEDMEVSSDDLATPVPEDVHVHETSRNNSVQKTRSEHTKDAMTLMELESASHSFTKQMIDGLYLHEDLASARKRTEDLRRLQHSRLYAHPSAVLRDKINANRHEAEHLHTLLSKKATSRSRKLSQIPDPGYLVPNLGTNWQTRNEALRSYLGDIEKWLEVIEPQTRLIITGHQDQLLTKRAEQHDPKLEGEPKYIPPPLEASVKLLREVHAQVQDFVQERSQLPEDHIEFELLHLFEEKEGDLYGARKSALMNAVDRAVLRRLDGFKQGCKKLEVGLRECDALIATSMEVSIEASLAPQRTSLAQLRRQIEEKRRIAKESREAARRAICGVHLASETLETNDPAMQLQSVRPHVVKKIHDHVDRAVADMESRCAQEAFTGLVGTVRDLMEPNIVLARYIDRRSLTPLAGA